MLALRAARAWGAKPLDFLTGWSARDRGLAIGLLAAEDSVDEWGIPWEVALDPARGSWLEARTEVSGSQAAVDRWKERRTKNSEPGAFPVMVDTYHDVPSSSPTTP